MSASNVQGSGNAGIRVLSHAPFPHGARHGCVLGRSAQSQVPREGEEIWHARAEDATWRLQRPSLRTVLNVRGEMYEPR